MIYIPAEPARLNDALEALLINALFDSTQRLRGLLLLVLDLVDEAA